MHLPREIGAHILPLPLDAVQDGVEALLSQRRFASELRMEVSGVSRHPGQRVVDLVIDCHVLLIPVLQRDPRFLAEGHLPVAIEGAARVHAHRQRVDLAILAPAAGEEIADGAFDRRLGLVVPIEAENRVPPITRGRHPNLLDAAGAFDLSQGKRFPGGDMDRGGHLPALA